MRVQWLVLAIALVVCTVPARADLTGWAAAPFVSDPDDSGIWPGTDILAGLWFANPGDGFYYFRMDLEMAPSRVIIGQDVYDNFADVYGIYVDYTPGGVHGAGDGWVPDQLTGIDAILDMHFDGTAWGPVEAHEWNGSAWVTVPYDQSPYLLGVYGVGWEQAAAGQSLQWRIPAALDQFVFWGATMSEGEARGANATYDITDWAAIPEPGTMALLGLGLTGTAYLKRRRSR